MPISHKVSSESTIVAPKPPRASRPTWCTGSSSSFPHAYFTYAPHESCIACATGPPDREYKATAGLASLRATASESKHCLLQDGVALQAGLHLEEDAEVLLSIAGPLIYGQHRHDMLPLQSTARYCPGHAPSIALARGLSMACPMCRLRIQCQIMAKRTGMPAALHASGQSSPAHCCLVLEH